MVCKPGCPEAWPEPETGAPRPLRDHTASALLVPSGVGRRGVGQQGEPCPSGHRGRGDGFFASRARSPGSQALPFLQWGCFSPTGPCTHAEAHTHSYAREGSRMHTCPPVSESDTHTHARAHADSCAHTYNLTHTPLLMCTRTRTCSYTPVRTHINLAHTCTHVHTHAHAFSPTCAHTRTPVHTHTHVLTRTWSHTVHTYKPSHMPTLLTCTHTYRCTPAHVPLHTNEHTRATRADMPGQSLPVNNMCGHLLGLESVPWAQLALSVAF